MLLVKPIYIYRSLKAKKNSETSAMLVNNEENNKEVSFLLTLAKKYKKY